MQFLGRETIRVLARPRSDRFERVTERVIAVVPDILARAVGQERHVDLAIVAVERVTLGCRARENTADVAVANQLCRDLVVGVALLHRLPKRHSKPSRTRYFSAVCIQLMDYHITVKKIGGNMFAYINNATNQPIIVALITLSLSPRRLATNNTMMTII